MARGLAHGRRTARPGAQRFRGEHVRRLENDRRCLRRRSGGRYPAEPDAGQRLRRPATGQQLPRRRRFDGNPDHPALRDSTQSHQLSRRRWRPRNHRDEPARRRRGCEIRERSAGRFRNAGLAVVGRCRFQRREIHSRVRRVAQRTGGTTVMRRNSGTTSRKAARC